MFNRLLHRLVARIRKPKPRYAKGTTVVLARTPGIGYRTYIDGTLQPGSFDAWDRIVNRYELAALFDALTWETLGLAGRPVGAPVSTDDARGLVRLLLEIDDHDERRFTVTFLADAY